MPFSYNDHDMMFPQELRDNIRVAVVTIIAAERTRLNTPITGGPSGGFPGFRMLEHKTEIIQARNDLIDKWNEEHPDGDS
jgi:hypothetical protein